MVSPRTERDRRRWRKGSAVLGDPAPPAQGCAGAWRGIPHFAGGSGSTGAKMRRRLAGNSAFCWGIRAPPAQGCAGAWRGIPHFAGDPGPTGARMRRRRQKEGAGLGDRRKDAPALAGNSAFCWGIRLHRRKDAPALAEGVFWVAPALAGGILFWVALALAGPYPTATSVPR